jgi:hypothetical protein
MLERARGVVGAQKAKKKKSTLDRAQEMITGKK